MIAALKRLAFSLGLATGLTLLLIIGGGLVFYLATGKLPVVEIKSEEGQVRVNVRPLSPAELAEYLQALAASRPAGGEHD